jgi:hypothetical protein
MDRQRRTTAAIEHQELLSFGAQAALSIYLQSVTEQLLMKYIHQTKPPGGRS